MSDSSSSSSSTSDTSSTKDDDDGILMADKATAVKKKSATATASSSSSSNVGATTTMDDDNGIRDEEEAPSTSTLKQPTCRLDPALVNPSTLKDMEDIGLSIFASACSKNRGAFVLDPPDGNTYGCLSLPTGILEMVGSDDGEEEGSVDINDSDSHRFLKKGKKNKNDASSKVSNYAKSLKVKPSSDKNNSTAGMMPTIPLFSSRNVTKAEDIVNHYQDGNLTSQETVELLNFLVERTYASTPQADLSPYACDMNGLGQLVDCPTSSSTTTDNPKIRAVTIAGVFSPAPWTVYNSSTPSGTTLTQKDAKFYYVKKDFFKMHRLGLNTVQFSVAVQLFGSTPKVHQGWQNLLQEWMEFAHQYHLQVILKLEDAHPRAHQGVLLTADLAAVTEALRFGQDLNDKYTLKNTTKVVMAVILPTTQPSVVEAAVSVEHDIPLWLPATPGDLVNNKIQTTLEAIASTKVAIAAIALDLSHTSTIAEVASSTADEDRAKLFYHETMACLKRTPLDYVTCYNNGLPVFVSNGFDLAIDDCHLKDVSTSFQNYGQCGRLSETIHSPWWNRHRQAFAAKQMTAYESGGIGWSFATWKVFRVGVDKAGVIDRAAKLLSLRDVYTRGWFPTIDVNATGAETKELSLACLNPPANDFVLGDETLAPTAGPPPDCGNGWWNATTKQCDYWVPPPFNASECPNTTIIYEECPQTKNITSQKQAAAAMEVQNTEHHLLQGFVLGALVALIVTAIASSITRRSRRHEYEAVRPINGWQEYQHYSRNSVKDVTSITGNKSISSQGRAAP